METLIQHVSDDQMSKLFKDRCKKEFGFEAVSQNLHLVNYIDTRILYVVADNEDDVVDFDVLENALSINAPERRSPLVEEVRYYVNGYLVSMFISKLPNLHFIMLTPMVVYCSEIYVDVSTRRINYQVLDENNERLVINMGNDEMSLNLNAQNWNNIPPDVLRKIAKIVTILGD